MLQLVIKKSHSWTMGKSTINYCLQKHKSEQSSFENTSIVPLFLYIMVLMKMLILDKSLFAKDEKVRFIVYRVKLLFIHNVVTYINKY